MGYNIEDHEDYLRNEMLFGMNEAEWQRMQQRIKDKILTGNTIPIPKKRRTFNVKAAVGIAAGLALLLSLLLPQTRWLSHHSLAENAEQKLDKTLGRLNEDELHWIQQLNENEIPEEDQYLENEVEL